MWRTWTLHCVQTHALCYSILVQHQILVVQTSPSTFLIYIRPTYYYGTGTPRKYRNRIRTFEVKIEGGVISKTEESIFKGKLLTALDPKSTPMSREGGVGFVQRLALYGVEDDLKVKSLSANSFLLYLKELSLPIDDLEVKVISIGEAEEW